MKNGFKETVDKILRKYGLKTRDCVGTVWADGDWSWLVLNAMGYRVEKGIKNPDYDYVILSKGKSTLKNLLEALHKTKLGCIIIFRVENMVSDAYLLAKAFNLGLHFYEYEDHKKALGVLFKGKEI